MPIKEALHSRSAFSGRKHQSEGGTLGPRENCIEKKSRSVEKTVNFSTIIEKTHQFHTNTKASMCQKTQKMGPFGLFVIQLGAENQNNQRGDPLTTF